MAIKRTAAAKSKAESSDAPETSVAVELNPKTTFYEFGGPLGAAAMVTFLPLLVLFLAVGCDKTGYPSQKVLSMTKDDFLALFSLNSLRVLFDPMAIGGYIAYIIWLVAFTLTVKGDKYPGSKLRNGKILKYECNGFSVLLSFFSLAIYCAKGPGIAPAIWVYEHWVGINVASILFAFAASFWAYSNSFEPGALLALGGNTGNMIYDFMIGRELNPRIGDLDVKFFVELRPPQMGWLLTNICMALTQYHNLGRITNSMALVVIFQAWYSIDSIWNEPLVLTTMDITNDGFGFMLAFGNLCWVPMVYGLQARYLVDFPLDLTIVQVILIIALQLTGFYIFRSANSLKNSFRTNPNDPALKDIKYIETKAGTRLMTNSWWGYSRHINYFGDLLMALAWCLPTGFSSPIPYLYFFYFAFLLWHRQGRDEHKCRQKYGEDWVKYCKIVPYKIIPGIY
ncbi:ERG4/ERG24 ergosterol biosynthesis protein [Umbelopsis sp. AD052]|nr:ERG4/ERG24 ergosterol biosynthesis protein [Umbelopsis sp. AD052]